MKHKEIIEKELQNLLHAKTQRGALRGVYGIWGVNWYSNDPSILRIGCGGLLDDYERNYTEIDLRRTPLNQIPGFLVPLAEIARHGPPKPTPP